MTVKVNEYNAQFQINLKEKESVGCFNARLRSKDALTRVYIDRNLGPVEHQVKNSIVKTALHCTARNNLYMNASV